MKNLPDQTRGYKKQLSFHWWETASAILRVSLKPWPIMPKLSLDLAKASAQFDDFIDQGISAVEVFAPAESGRSFSGLDAKNHFRIDPALGTMEDFANLVALAHSKGLAIITFDNLGYCSVNAPHFLQACDDIRDGRKSPEVRMFSWSDKPDAPPPTTGDSFYLVRPGFLGYDAPSHEFWQWNERAQRYYWTKWAGVDDGGEACRLPQYNWASSEWQLEAKNIVRHWMETGIDGMIVDAVNWYTGCTWAVGRRCMTDVILGFNRGFCQPEGGGGFKDDPVAWISEGGWNCVQDYGLGIWWELGSNVVENAINGGNPRPIERALRDYHDRVVAAGGALYAPPVHYDDQAKRRLALASLISFGVLAQLPGERGAFEKDEEIAWLLKQKLLHPALHQLSIRRNLSTNADDKYYAFLRTARESAARLLVVLNYQPTEQTVHVDLSGVATTDLVDIRNGTPTEPRTWLNVKLPAYGYRLFTL